MISNRVILVVLLFIALQIIHITCFSRLQQQHHHLCRSSSIIYQHHRHNIKLQALSEDEERELKIIQEESRLKVLTDRRKTIRNILKSAEGTKNFRIKNGYVPEVDPETGKPIKSDGQLAVTLTGESDSMCNCIWN